MSIRVRFAPSPTGDLHVGGARTALFNWLMARKSGGTFILRVEDTDGARNTAEAAAGIIKGMRWLGLDWDEGPEVGGDCGPYFQSQRKDIYDAYFKKLEDAGRVYAEADGAMRFKFSRTAITVHDLVCGDVTFAPTEEPDMTIRRPDGSYIFHFVNVVDDIEMRISHVIRGEDHLSNTWKHIDLFNAFGATAPTYAHIPLILNPDGTKMSKRDEGSAIEHSYMNEGFLPDAVFNYLCTLGWTPRAEKEVLSRDELVPLAAQHLLRLVLVQLLVDGERLRRDGRVLRGRGNGCGARGGARPAGSLFPGQGRPRPASARSGERLPGRHGRVRVDGGETDEGVQQRDQLGIGRPVERPALGPGREAGRHQQQHRRRRGTCRKSGPSPAAT